MIRSAFFGTLLFLSFCNPLMAQVRAAIEINEGSVLVYKIKEGKKNYIYTVTIQSLTEDLIDFDWTTNESTPRNGNVTTYPGFDELDVEHVLVSSFKNGYEQLESGWERLFMPAVVTAPAEDNPSNIAMDINGKTDGLDISTKPKGVGRLTYNGTTVVAAYKELANKQDEVNVGYIPCHDDANHNIICFYQDKEISMQLISIKTSIKEENIMPATKPVEAKKKREPQKMEAAKFNIVKIQYPVLSRLENFDPTKAGAEPKPFEETYDYRAGSNTANPPSLVDCFICDLRILYNQRATFYEFAGHVDEAVTEKSFPASAVIKLMQIYIKGDVRKTPGYRPWSHRQFVKTLTETEMQKLSKEVESYVKTYGILDAN